ncbi:MAG: hypothetical protein IPI84_11415 [Holophagaceae bacterium]|nr:hypothetical protein [Holophagaceae bacterium]
MDRKQFLKLACGLGACGCATRLAAHSRALEAPKPRPVEDPRLGFTRHQVARLIGFMGAGLPAEACAGVIEQAGRECAKLTQLHARFKHDPEGYFEAGKKNWGTEFTWDKLKGIITVTVAEGPCGCPLVDAKRTPALWCNCSVGYQKESFETVFGRPVKARLLASKLSGSKHCVFEVTLC